ncbi:MAG TPA: hypothetical protein VLA29_05220 [Acidimicrobiia bacterium]|nr:hypothetical protein [Acidimicrobiia bacterium]
MPRPDKQINNRGPLDGPVSASRPVVWKKYAGPEMIEVADDSSAAMEVAVDDITVSTQPAPPPEEISKWTARATAAQLPRAAVSDDFVVEPRTRPEPRTTRTEWVVTRTIDGRTYRRTDVLTTVEEHAGA